PIANPAIDARISPDGKYLAYADQSGIRLQLIETGETRTVAQPEALGSEAMEWFPAGWFPDGTKFLANAWSPATQRSSIWVVSMLGGAPREIRDEGYAWSVSRDGSLIAFTTDVNAPSDIWLMGANGEQPRKTVTAGDGESLSDVVWSPDGQRIAYIKRRGVPPPESTIESRSLKGGQPTFILSDMKLQAGLWWSQDGRIFCSRKESTQTGIDANLRVGNVDIFKQRLDKDTAEPVVATPQVESEPRLSCDGSWILYLKTEDLESWFAPVAPVQVMRVRLSGGPSQFVLTARRIVGYRCARAPSSLCFLAELSADRKH